MAKWNEYLPSNFQSNDKWQHPINSYPWKLEPGTGGGVPRESLIVLDLSESWRKQNITHKVVTQATIKYSRSFLRTWAMGFCGYDELFNRKKFSWFTVTCELLMVKWVSPGESGKISRELLLQGHCSSFSSFQRLGHTKQISTVNVHVSRRMLSPQSPGMDLQL